MSMYPPRWTTQAAASVTRLISHIICLEIAALTRLWRTLFCHLQRLGQCILLCVSMHFVLWETRVSIHLTLKIYSSSFSALQEMKLTHHHAKVTLIFQHQIAEPQKKNLKKKINKQALQNGDACLHQHKGRPSWKEALTSVNASSIHTRDVGPESGCRRSGGSMHALEPAYTTNITTCNIQ